VFNLTKKSNFVLGINGFIGQTFVQENSPKDYIFFVNNKFNPLQNSTTNIVSSNIGLNLGYEYILK
jgi:hypothetical protein